MALPVQEFDRLAAQCEVDANGTRFAETGVDAWGLRSKSWQEFSKCDAPQTMLER